MPDESGTQAIHLSVNVSDCYGSRSVEIARKYMDSGGDRMECQLCRFVMDKSLADDDKYFKYATLAAAAMTLGCTLRPKNKEHLKRLTAREDINAFCTPRARAQMKQALSSYVDGTPYDFGNKTPAERKLGSRFPGSAVVTTNVGNLKVLEARLPNGTTVPQLQNPPSDEELGLKPIYEYHVCANCGADKAKGGEAALLVSEKCKERQYCSQKCQKEHSKLHRLICEQPEEYMEPFMESILLDWVGEAEPDFETLLGFWKSSTGNVATEEASFEGREGSAS